MKKLNLLIAGILLVAGYNLIWSQIPATTASPKAAGEPVAPLSNYAASISGQALQSGSWDNISEGFTRRIGVHDVTPAYLGRCQGMIVTPDGDILMQTSSNGICISKDQGATWSVVEDNDITGRCEHGSAFSIAYPYNGRMAFFCYDGGKWGTSGGMSLDGGKTWEPFTKLQRGVEFGDVDWSARAPQTIFAITHEPEYSIISHDGGRRWRQLDKSETGAHLRYSIGLIDENKLIRYNAGKDGGIIEFSEDAGKTWTKVADYQVRARAVVHYGSKVYWTTTKGVITSSNGKDWTLTGDGAEGANYGPYFGSSDKEFIVVNDKYFLKTQDGGRTWKAVANLFKAPDIFHDQANYSFFGWDPKRNILYASGLGASIYKLQLP